MSIVKITSTYTIYFANIFGFHQSATLHICSKHTLFLGFLLIVYGDYHAFFFTHTYIYIHIKRIFLSYNTFDFITQKPIFERTPLLILFCIFNIYIWFFFVLSIFDTEKRNIIFTQTYRKQYIVTIVTEMNVVDTGYVMKWTRWRRTCGKIDFRRIIVVPARRPWVGERARKRENEWGRERESEKDWNRRVQQVSRPVAYGLVRPTKPTSHNGCENTLGNLLGFTNRLMVHAIFLASVLEMNSARYRVSC